MHRKTHRGVLPAGYFQCPKLGDNEVEYLVAQAKNSARSLVEVVRNTSGPIRWLPSGSHRGVQVFRGEERDRNSVNTQNVPAGQYIRYVCGATRIMASLDEVAGYFDSSTTEKARSLHEDILDSVVLYTIVHPTRANAMHQITVKWTAIELSSSLIRNRDFCTLECHDRFLDYSGRQGWVRSMHSIKLPCCPELTDFNFVRGSMYNTGYVCVESDTKGYVDLIHCIQINLKGKLRLPRPVYFYACRRRVSLLSHMSTHLQQKRLQKCRLLQKLELIPKSERDHCGICKMKFRVLNRKMQCRACGEVICSDCNQKYTLQSEHHTARKDCKVRICIQCCTANRDVGRMMVVDEHASSAYEPQADTYMQSRFIGQNVVSSDLYAGYGSGDCKLNERHLEISNLTTHSAPCARITASTDETCSTISEAVPLMESRLPLLSSQMTEDDGELINKGPVRMHLPPTMHETSMEADDDWDLDQSYGVDDDADFGEPERYGKYKNLQVMRNMEAIGGCQQLTDRLQCSQMISESDFDGEATEYMIDEHRMSMHNPHAKSSAIAFNIRLQSEVDMGFRHSDASIDSLGSHSSWSGYSSSVGA